MFEQQIDDMRPAFGEVGPDGLYNLPQGVEMSPHAVEFWLRYGDLTLIPPDEDPRQARAIAQFGGAPKHRHPYFLVCLAAILLRVEVVAEKSA